jgi:quercetin 2,3-dioxygenase
MFTVRRADDRGTFDHGWLQTAHTFSFGDYHDRNWMQFRALRVMNEDHVAPGQGFGMHGHRDMEIVTYVLSGTLAHRDSLGHEAALQPGEVQYMSAGTGIRHSEFNPSSTEPVHLYQIWLLPRQTGLKPHYEQHAFPVAGRQGQWQTVVAGEPKDGAIVVQQDTSVLLAELTAGQSLSYDFPTGRYGWLQVLSGRADVGGTECTAGDGVGISEEPRLTVQAKEATAVMLFDLP